MTSVGLAQRRGSGEVARLWFAGARPRTLGVGVVPVLVGAAASGRPKPVPTLAALVVSLSLQVGANYANDYFDGVRGVDTEARIGPRRLTASGMVGARAVLNAALLCLATGAGVGLWLTIATGLGWLSLAAGLVALSAALLYTGGPRPYAATGVVADLAVFVFFGLMATVGTAAVQGSGVPAAAWWSGSAVGLLAVSVLVANNLRDLATDRAAGRHTLVVRLGDDRSRLLYAGLILGGALLAPGLGVAAGQLPVAALLMLCAAPGLVRPLGMVSRSPASGRVLAPLLPLTARLQAFAGVLLALGVLAGAPPGISAPVAVGIGLVVAAWLTVSDLLPRLRRARSR